MKAIAVYYDVRGSEIAIAENYAIYIRFQEKNNYGYYWTRWLLAGNSDGKIPYTIAVGFGTARKKCGIFKYRLPNKNIIRSKLRIKIEDFDSEEPKYNDII